MLEEANERQAALAIRLFGSFEVRLAGKSLPRLRTRKEQWLLALLALHQDREVDRAWLAGTLWPDSSLDQCLANLRRSLRLLRRALGSEATRLLSPTRRAVALDLRGAAVDVAAFDAAITRGDPASLEAAIALYRGPLLEGCVEEWVVPERERREQEYLAALESLAEQALAHGEPGSAEQYLRRAVVVDPLRESAQRALMHSLAVGGSATAALEVYRELRLRLHRELNAEPDPETKALCQQIRAGARGKAARVARVTMLADGETQPHALREGALPSRAPAAQSPALPSGTVTFLFTDIEGSTRLWDEHTEAMRRALARHDELLQQAIIAHGGSVFKTFGDQFCAAFGAAPEALSAALAAQQALESEPWTLPSPLRVRMALHTGTAEPCDGEYFGPPLNRTACLLEAGHGGQILLSLATAELLRDRLPDGVDLVDLGERRLPDLVRPERVFQLLCPGLPVDFPPLRSPELMRHNLPRPLTSFVGRERERAEVNELLESGCLLTLTGAGGCGKSRLALQVAWE
jgi:DNA-binding SARP family transcriptional activator